jgi:hypothetical protein
MPLPRAHGATPASTPSAMRKSVALFCLCLTSSVRKPAMRMPISATHRVGEFGQAVADPLDVHFGRLLPVENWIEMESVDVAVEGFARQGEQLLAIVGHGQAQLAWCSTWGSSVLSKRKAYSTCVSAR